MNNGVKLKRKFHFLKLILASMNESAFPNLMNVFYAIKKLNNLYGWCHKLEKMKLTAKNLKNYCKTEKLFKKCVAAQKSFFSRKMEFK